MKPTRPPASILTGLSHIGFTVGDVQQAVEFYTNLFGEAPAVRDIYDRPYTSRQVGYDRAVLDIAIFRIPASEVRLELIQYLHPVGTAVDVETKNPGTAHLCLMTDNIGDVHIRMQLLGATPRSEEPVVITAGPNAGRRVCYYRDPQGITVEVMEIRHESEVR